MSNTLFSEAFQQHKEIGEEGKKKYEEIYRRMVDKLSASHLEPFSQILLEHVGHDFNCEVTMNSIKASLLKELVDSWNKNIWEPIAAEKLASLEMLKEHFKQHEGITNWNINDMSPRQRLLPLRLRYKAARSHFLQTQIEHQNRVLTDKSLQATQRRQFLQQIAEECTLLNECIAEQVSEENQLKEKAIKEEVYKLLLNDNNAFKARPKINPEF